jgi:hypothetical protein
MYDKQFMSTVNSIIQWSLKHNEHREGHLPVIGVSYGYLAMVNALTRQGGIIKMPEDMQN